MTQPRDPDAIVAAWLDEGPDRLPEATRRAIDVSSRTIDQQRQPPRLPWRDSNVSGPARFAIGAVALVTVAVGGLLLTNLNKTPTPPTSGQGAQATSRPAVSPAATASVLAPRADLRGLIAFSRVSGAVARILVAKPDGSDMTPLILANDSSQPAWSPDDAKIAWAAPDGIRAANADGAGIVQLTNGAGDRNPAWSPDGSSIVFARNRGGTLDLYTQPVAGGGPKQLTDSAGDDDHPSWAASSNRIAFESARAGTIDIWSMNPDGGGLTQLTDNDGRDMDPAWSPDGTKIAFASDRGGGPSLIYVMNADGSHVERLSAGPDPGSDPTWSPDGRFIAFTQVGSNATIVVIDVATQQVVSTLIQQRAELGSPAWSHHQ
jgi:Tol biopolymer transport system component